MKEFGEALGKIPATLFSPAKMVYMYLYSFFSLKLRTTIGAEFG